MPLTNRNSKVDQHESKQQEENKTFVFQPKAETLKSNLISNLLQASHIKTKVADTFLYTFADISPNNVLELISELKRYPKDTPDTLIVGKIYNWYSSLPAEQKIGFTMTAQEYQTAKATKIANTITSKMLPGQIEGLNGKNLLDIGAGDCAMTYLEI